MADYQYLDGTGVIVPDTSVLQAQVEGEYRAVFGQDIITDPSTPQGVLITAEVAARSAVVQNNAAVANQINPNLAGGVFLDAIWALTGGQRIAASYSVVPGVTLGGLAGTFIPAGSQISLPDGTLFASVSDVTLSAGGTGAVDFQAVVAGPVAVAPGATWTPVTAILGWDTATNATAATIGRAQESDLAARQRRKNTLSLQNVALPAAITSALYNVPNVTSLQFRENTTDATATIDGISLVAHSVWACVSGGLDSDVAAALLANKSMGANWNGAQSATLVDPASGQSYIVKWDRPATIAVQVQITVKNLSSVTDITTAVRKAMTDYAAGILTGEPGLGVGDNVSAFELAGAVNQENPGIYVQSCQVSLKSVVSWVTEITIALDEIATLASGDIAVTVL